MRIPTVVERRLAFQLKRDAPSHGLDAPDEHAGVPLFRISHGHEIGDLTSSVSRAKASDEYVRGGPVVLAFGKTLFHRKDAKAAALGMVKKSSKHAGRVKAGKAKPVDGPVHRDEGGGSHVPDDPVPFYRWVRRAVRCYRGGAVCLGSSTAACFHKGDDRTSCGQDLEMLFSKHWLPFIPNRACLWVGLLHGNLLHPTTRTRLLRADGFEPFVKLPLGLLFGDSVTFLDPSHELVFAARHYFQIVIRKLTPLLPNLTSDLRPLPFYLISIHCLSPP